MAASIAIVIVMFIINAFMVYALIRTWERVNEKMEKYFLVKTADFANKERKPMRESSFAVEDGERKVVIETKQLYLADQVIDKTSYKNSDFKDDYKAVKESMDFSKKEIIEEVVKAGEETVKDTVALELSKIFDFNTIYELSTLDSNQQLEILKTSFEEKQKELLNTYLNTHPGIFNAVEFFDYVNQLSKSQDPNFYVKTGWKNDNFDNLADNVVTVHDGQITEGVKIIHKDKLYDYSI